MQILWERALYNGVLSGNGFGRKSFLCESAGGAAGGVPKMNGNFMSNRYGRNGSDVHAARQILRA